MRNEWAIPMIWLCLSRDDQYADRPPPLHYNDFLFPQSGGPPSFGDLEGDAVFYFSLFLIDGLQKSTPPTVLICSDCSVSLSLPLRLRGQLYTFCKPRAIKPSFPLCNALHWKLVTNALRLISRWCAT